MQIIAANTEVERSREIRGETELLTQLPGMFIGEVLGNKPIGTAQLRVAEITCRHTVGAACRTRTAQSNGAATGRIARTIGANLKAAGIGYGSIARHEKARRCPEPVIIFGRIQEIMAEAGLRCECEGGRNRIICVELNDIVLGLIDRIKT